MSVVASLLCSIELKKMERSYGLGVVFSSIPHLKHQNDGLVFTPVHAAYKPGTCNRLLKWKPPQMNTVDFKIYMHTNAEMKPVYKLYVTQGRNERMWDYLQPDPELYQK